MGDSLSEGSAQKPALTIGCSIGSVAAVEREGCNSLLRLAAGCTPILMGTTLFPRRRYILELVT